MTSSFPQEPWVKILPTDAFDNARLAEILELWHLKRGDRLMPSRRDFDPLEMKRDLGWIVLVDVESNPTRFRYRLIGTSITQLVGRDATGAYLDDLYQGSVETIATMSFRKLLTTRTPNRILGTMHHAKKGHLNFEAIDLPLSSDGETVDMIMVRSVFEPWRRSEGSV
ncbi:MAG: PAS domain-containing protein [Thalassobaculum sp.]|uniref:PAS domain-containing protein n=1 Tax=Thalassobaculum sp. TaxID=2022740 RepID=UPI0032ECA2B9